MEALSYIERILTVILKWSDSTTLSLFRTFTIVLLYAKLGYKDAMLTLFMEGVKCFGTGAG